MASISGDLIWEIAKRNNAFLVEEFGNGTGKLQFSKETTGLCNVNSHKHSGERVRFFYLAFSIAVDANAFPDDLT